MSPGRVCTKKLRGTFHSSVPEGLGSQYTKQAKAHALRERLAVPRVFLKVPSFLVRE